MNHKWKVALKGQSQKLVELGVVLETEKVWVRSMIINEWILMFCHQIDLSTVLIEERYPAPDVSELGRVLPDYGDLTVQKENGGSAYTWYYYSNRSGKRGSGSYKTEAQARCAALIWLIDSKTCVWDQEAQTLKAA